MNRDEYFDTKKIKGRAQKIVAEGVANALRYFCDKEPEFEQAIEQSGKSFTDCLDEIVKDVGPSKPGLSDFEVYNRAAKFYFTTAKIWYTMNIDLCGDNGAEKPPITMTKKDTLSISLDDLLDF
ncbi:MAG: hypothetical protein K5898_03490 [Ruminococcus sp.]|uniref:hypothetical protein n=1 Tax=Ruminococcus sp. TaxID=41978 RepID=UPI0025EC7721|nr:hypothetical protein [Ruminococcus sp.]MCR4794231.1 hypothetical protein [Ruminococcus sp.]